MFILISNEPIKVADLQKLANQLLQNGALVIEMVNNSFSESNKNFGRLIKRGRFLSRQKLTDSVPAVHRNIFRYRKSLKTAWVKTRDLQMMTASELIGAIVTVLGKYTFVTLRSYHGICQRVVQLSTVSIIIL